MLIAFDMLLCWEKNLLPVLSVLGKKDLHPRRDCTVLMQYKNSISRMRAKRIEVETGLSFEAIEGTELEDHQVSSALEGNDLVFFTHTLCPYAERTWISLLEKVSVVLTKLINSVKGALYVILLCMHAYAECRRLQADSC